MKRPDFVRIPCGRVLGHGLSCSEGYYCDQCEYILELEWIAKIKELKLLTPLETIVVKNFIKKRNVFSV